MGWADGEGVEGKWGRKAGGFRFTLVEKKMRTWIPCRRGRCLIFVAVILLSGCRPATSAPVDGYTVVAKYPHSTGSYTEGFFYLDGMFYEGTGMVGRSVVMAVDPATGKISMESPVGRALLGHKSGDSVQVQTPGGAKTLKITKLG